MSTEALRVQVGIASDQGPRDRNEDFAACLAPAPGRSGLIAAVADGVGGAKGGRVAAETAVRLFLDAVEALNPLRGVNDDRLGPRWPDLCEPYSKSLIQLARSSALELGIHVQKGVFVAVSGPNLETRAEYRMLKQMGADVVGMSTVPEVLVAIHAGMKVLGFSVVTDMCLPDHLEPAEVPKILATAAIGGEKLARLIPRVVEQLS